MDQRKIDPTLLREMDWPQSTAEIAFHVFFEDSMAGGFGA
jgi:hypothetical protein